VVLHCSQFTFSLRLLERERERKHWFIIWHHH